jgi:hypothetical protein
MHAVSRSVHTVLAALAASLAILVVVRLPSAWVVTLGIEATGPGLAARPAPYFVDVPLPARGFPGDPSDARGTR